MPVVKFRPSAEIIERHRYLAEKHAAFRLMQNLVDRTCGFEILKRAFATTSMQTLLVAQTPEFEWDKEILRVSLDVHSGELVFDFRKPGPICSNTGTEFDAVRLKRVSPGSKDFSRSRSGLSYTRSSPQWTSETSTLQQLTLGQSGLRSSWCNRLILTIGLTRSAND